MIHYNRKATDDDSVLLSSSSSSSSSSSNSFSSTSTTSSATATSRLRPLRSISLPCRPCCLLALGLEDDLQKLRTWLQSPKKTTKAKSLAVGLALLSNLYRSVEEVLHIPAAISRLRGGKKECVDELLEGYVRLLDACSVVRESLVTTKEHTQDLHSVLRRRGGRGGARRENNKDIVRDIESYFRSRNRVKKMVWRCLKELRQRVAYRWSCRLVGTSSDISTLVKESTLTLMKAMAEVMVVSASVLSCVLEYFVSNKTEGCCSSKRWWWLWSPGHHHHCSRKKKVIAASVELEAADDHGNDHPNPEDEEEEVNVFLSSVDASIHSLHKHLSTSSSTSNNKIDCLQEARQKLEATEESMDNLESGLENIFKEMIHNRLSLLNILYY